MRIAVVTLLALVLLAGCGGSGHLRSEPGAAQPHRAAPLRVPRHSLVRGSCDVASTIRATADRSYAALVRGDAAIRTAPAGGRVLVRVARLDVNGYPTVLGVLGVRPARHGCRAAAYRVQLPTPPNGRSGWIDAGAVRVFAVRNRIVVDLSARRLTAYRAGAPALRVPVAVGASSTPTPTGRYVVDERWLLENANGPFGIAALGISAHSAVLRDWVQGGPIALHGTNEPWSIGRAASHGCVRLRNADMRRLLRLAPAGTPVVIRR